jgi:hypothetical protein
MKLRDTPAYVMQTFLNAGLKNRKIDPKIASDFRERKTDLCILAALGEDYTIDFAT